MLVREGPVGGDDVQELDLQQVAGRGALHVDGAGERVRAAGVGVLQRFDGARARYLVVGGRARLEHDLLTLVGLDHGRDVRVKPVVALLRLFEQRLGPVDLDLFHGGSVRVPQA